VTIIFYVPNDQDYSGISGLSVS